MHIKLCMFWFSTASTKRPTFHHSPVSWPWRHWKEVKRGAETVWLCPPQSPLSLYTRPLLSAHAHWPPVAGRSVVPTLCWWKKGGSVVANVASRWDHGGTVFDGDFCRRSSKLMLWNSEYWLFFNSDVHLVEKLHGFNIFFRNELF